MDTTNEGRPRRGATDPDIERRLVQRYLLDRRRFLALGALSAAGGSAWLAGCATEKLPVGAESLPEIGPSGATPASSATYDAAVDYWKQGNFAPITTEYEFTILEVEGSIPPELDGLYVRNGSNPPKNDAPHWFFGDGMVHGIRFEKGSAAWYRNRYVDTALHAAGKGFLGAGAPGGTATMSNVSLIWHANTLLALGEVGFPYALSTKDLSTVGPHDYGGRLTTSMTAHPKIDPATGDMHFFGYGFVPPYLTYHVADAGGTLTSSQEIAVGGPTMMHDFAITERHAIFWELPVVFSLDDAISGAGMPFKWQPSYGARIGVMPLGGSTSEIRWVEIEPCYVFHGVNAHERDGLIALDVCRLPSAFDETADLRPSALHRWTIDTNPIALTLGDEQLSDEPMDLPSIDRRLTGRPHDNAWFAQTDNSGPYGFEFAGITRLNRAGTADRWSPGPLYRAGEVTFVPSGPSDSTGYLLSYVYDRSRDASDLVVLDATDLARGPIARVKLPHRVPYGFHGWWIPAADTA